MPFITFVLPKNTVKLNDSGNEPLMMKINLSLVKCSVSFFHQPNNYARLLKCTLVLQNIFMRSDPEHLHRLTLSQDVGQCRDPRWR